MTKTSYDKLANLPGKIRALQARILSMSKKLDNLVDVWEASGDASKRECAQQLRAILEG